MGTLNSLLLPSVHNPSLHGPLHAFFLASLPSSDLSSKRLNLEPTFCLAQAQEHGVAGEKHILLIYFTFIFCSQISGGPKFYSSFWVNWNPSSLRLYSTWSWPSSDFEHLSFSNDRISNEMDAAATTSTDSHYLPVSQSISLPASTLSDLLFSLLRWVRFPHDPFLTPVPHSLWPQQGLCSRLYFLYSWLFPVSPLLFISPQLVCFLRTHEHAVIFSFL